MLVKFIIILATRKDIVMKNKLIIALVVILIVMIAAGIFLLNPGHAKVDSRVIVTSNSTLHDGDNFTIRLTD